MRFTPLPLGGAYLVDLELRGDHRGFFARAFCVDEFATQGLVTVFVQMNDSFSAEDGTLRGLHYQKAPHAETKLVRCIRGALFDVILDLRPDSPTFGQSYGVELTAENRRAIYVPKGFAHGSITLSANTEMLYLVDEHHSPAAEAGVRWNDPEFKIVWPRTPAILSEKDRNLPDLDRSAFLRSALPGHGPR